jgi:cell division protein FtsW
MTLPFISYGGSSLIAMSITMGFVLALTKRRPESLRTRHAGMSLRRYTPAE